MTTLVWFRNDLRLADHAALRAAVDAGAAIVPVFVWSPEDEAPWAPGPAARWWLHGALASLDASLRALGSHLVLRRGPAPQAMMRLAEETEAAAVHWTDRLAPPLRSIDDAVATALSAAGVACHRCPGRILHDPATVRTTSNGPYHVFTPFWKKLRASLAVGTPLAAPVRGALRSPVQMPASLPLDALDLRSGTATSPAVMDAGPVSEQAAHHRLDAFLADDLAHYHELRDLPAEDATSRLSPYLAHGQIGPRQVWHAVQRWMERGGPQTPAEKYLSELGWREFSYHLLHHYPHTTDEPLKASFAHFPWTRDDGHQSAWQQGRTGYPLVDAGMRQLRATGWMHNRVRMIVAAFLTKDLLQPWQEGTRWFWDHLVDADLANNTMGWQWSAGCGADAQPFFRIFNPVTQGRRYDPDGSYVRRWVPELSRLDTRFVHAPWMAPDDALRSAGIHLGGEYPRPIVHHGEARLRALAAYDAVKALSRR